MTAVGLMWVSACAKGGVFGIDSTMDQRFAIRMAVLAAFCNTDGGAVSVLKFR